MKRVEELKIWWPFAALFVLLLGPLLTLQKSFISSDFFVQHVPWSMEAFAAIRRNALPLWTGGMCNGFPLFAEGQCAALYFLNLLTFKLMPFWAAYTWGIPFHILAGGVSFYLYARSLGAGKEASVLGATVFCFSSGYAGCFYTTGSLRALCWMPLGLWMLQRVREAKRPPLGWWAAFSFLISQQWCSGYPQLAVYGFGYYFLHELLAGNKRRTLPFLSASLAAGTALAWPQIAATLELARFSVRGGAGLGFALWGSAPPVAPVSLLFPEWGNTLRYAFYIGILPLFFACASFFLKKPEAWRRHALLAPFFFLLALGKYNPLYVWAIDTFNLTSMRVPSKFLFFASFSLSALAVFGYDALRREKTASRGARRAARFAAVLAAVSALLPLAATLCLRVLERFRPVFSEWYVSRLIAEKGAQAKDPSYYAAILKSILDSLAGLFSYGHWLNLQAIAVAAASAWLLWALAGHRLPAKKTHAAVSLILVWDLCVFGFFLSTGFVGNAAPIKKLRPTPAMELVQKAAAQSPGVFVEIVRDPSKEIFPPNAGMGYSVPHAGGYSPLLTKSYENLVRDLGIADSSMGRRPFSEEVWGSQRALVDLVGARHIHSDFPLSWGGLRPLEARDGFYLYENERALPKLKAFYRWRVLADPDERLSWMKSEKYRAAEELVLEDASAVQALSPKAGAGEPGFLLAEGDGAGKLRFFADMPSDGMVMVRVAAYPGWRLEVDGEARAWHTVNHAFIGFALREGKHKVELSYTPGWWGVSWAVSGLAAAALLAAVVFQFLSVKSYNRRP